jgi:glycosyltransferase involved in cell wall biosynthesis
MNVLWLTHRDPLHPSAGGVERSVREIGRRLVDRGHSVHVIASKWPGAESSACVDGLQIRRIGPAALLHLATIVEVRHTNHERVIIDDLGHVVPWFSPWFTSSAGTVFFHHLHKRTLAGQVRYPAREILKLLEKSYPQIYSEWQFVTESTSSAHDLEGLRVHHDRIKRIRPGVDLQLFKPGEKSRDPTVVYFAGLRAYKRPMDAILAVKHLSHKLPTARLIMIGDGPLLRALRTQTSSSGMSERVTFMGRLDDRRLAKVLATSWVNIHCATAEGWGFSISESMSSGVPTVAYRAVGVDEAVIQGETGLLVDEATPFALSQALETMISENESWSRNCLSHRGELDWNRTAIAWERHLKETLDNASALGAGRKGEMGLD